MADDPLLEQPDGATKLEPEELEALIPLYITLRGELNEAEQENILEAEDWAFARKRNVVNADFLNTLHAKMFGNVWKWAGKFRRTEKNIGVNPVRIAIDLRELCDDATYWIDHETHDPDEIAARFHHRLDYIHPYANGNGRHARLAADLLLRQLDRPRFTWGRQSLVDPGATRSAYIQALRAADGHDYAPLFAFVRS